VEFLGRLEPEDRERLLAVSDSVRLSAGETLLRRGERGGDIYQVESGALEVVDRRQHPEVVLDVLGPGKVLGIMSFVDGAPHTAEVRAASAVTCRRWDQTALKLLLAQDPPLSARFFAALSGAVVQQARTARGPGRAAAVGRLAQDGGAVPVAVADKARDIASSSHQVWTEAEVRLRASPTDAVALNDCMSAFGALVEAAAAWIGPMGEHARAQAAGEALRKEVQPYLGRTRLVLLAQEAGLGANGAEFMAHLLLGEPAGDGALGQALDQALLALPTAIGVRARQRTAVSATLEGLPTDRPLAVTIVQPNCGALLAQLVSRLSGQGGEVTVIDGDRETLGIVDLGMHKRPVGVTLKLVQENLALLAAGRSSIHHPPQDAIVIDGLIDHLPDRMLASLSGWCAAHLAPGGRLVCTAMAPATDQEVFDHLLGWPLMRRTQAELVELIGSAGLEPSCPPIEGDEKHAGVVVVAVS
jgi:hypothetical protein